MPAQKFRFIIIEKDSFVARDMQDGLLSALPGCDTLCLPDPGDIAAVAATLDPVERTRTVIVTKLSLEELEENGLARIAAEIGADIVVRMGEDSPVAVATRGWHSLACPFSRDDLAALVADLAHRSAHA